MRSPALASAFLIALTVFAPACKSGDGTRLAAILELVGDSGSGGGLYSSNCASCHGADATGAQAPGVAGMEKDVIVEAALAGPDVMPSFDSLENQELADIATFVNGL